MREIMINCLWIFYTPLRDLLTWLVKYKSSHLILLYSGFAMGDENLLDSSRQCVGCQRIVRMCRMPKNLPELYKSLSNLHTMYPVYREDYEDEARLGVDKIHQVYLYNLQNGYSYTEPSFHMLDFVYKGEVQLNVMLKYCAILQYTSLRIP